MKVVVTGGSGRIGSATVSILRDAGHEVLSLDIRPPKNLEQNFKVMDLRDRAAARQVFEGYEAICHLGEMPNIFRGDSHYCYSHNTHVGSLVMETAAEVGMQKIIYTSTCQTYGSWGAENNKLVPPLSLPMDETHPLQPCNAYALSKATNEKYAALLSERKQIPVAAFRLPMTWDQSQIDERIQGMLSNPCRKPSRDGLGTYLHADDAARAYLCAIESTWEGFEAFHFVADDVSFKIPVRPVLLEYFPNTPLPHDWPEHASPLLTTKAHNLLNWRPRFSLHKACQEARQALAKAV